MQQQQIQSIYIELSSVITLNDLGERISSVWPKFLFYNKKGS